VGAYLTVRRWIARREFLERGRHARYEFFTTTCRLTATDTILDVGAGQGAALERYNHGNRIVALDLLEKNRESLERHPNVTFQAGDATAMPFTDRTFDVVFSNSVIEHVPMDKWPTFASEIRRVGDRYFVQTPNKWFPIEPHYMLPLVQFLPRRLRHLLDERFAGGKIDLLDERTLGDLFPDAEIRRERMLGLTKSLMAVRVALPSGESPLGGGSGTYKWHFALPRAWQWRERTRRFRC
jgi:hypothetical protein